MHWLQYPFLDLIESRQTTKRLSIFPFFLFFPPRWRRYKFLVLHKRNYVFSSSYNAHRSFFIVGWWLGTVVVFQQGHPGPSAFGSNWITSVTVRQPSRAVKNEPLLYIRRVMTTRVSQVRGGGNSAVRSIDQPNSLIFKFWRPPIFTLSTDLLLADHRLISSYRSRWK